MLTPRESVTDYHTNVFVVLYLLNVGTIELSITDGNDCMVMCTSSQASRDPSSRDA